MLTLENIQRLREVHLKSNTSVWEYRPMYADVYAHGISGHYSMSVAAVRNGSSENGIAIAEEHNVFTSLLDMAEECILLRAKQEKPKENATVYQEGEDL